MGVMFHGLNGLQLLLIIPINDVIIKVTIFQTNSLFIMSFVTTVRFHISCRYLPIEQSIYQISFI